MDITKIWHFLSHPPPRSRLVLSAGELAFRRTARWPKSDQGADLRLHFAQLVAVPGRLSPLSGAGHHRNYKLTRLENSGPSVAAFFKILEIVIRNFLFPHWLSKNAQNITQPSMHFLHFIYKLEPTTSHFF